jgi:hypothetical protein
LDVVVEKISWNSLIPVFGYTVGSVAPLHESVSSQTKFYVIPLSRDNSATIPVSLRNSVTKPAYKLQHNSTDSCRITRVNVMSQEYISSGRLKTLPCWEFRLFLPPLCTTLRGGRLCVVLYVT